MVKTVKKIRMLISNRFIRRIIITLILVIILLSSIVTIVQHFETPSLTLVSRQRSNLDRYPSSNRISHSKNFTQHKSPPPTAHHPQKESVSEKLAKNTVESLIYRPANDSTILRALLLFYPNDQDLEFQSELRWFYRSWIEMMTVESPLWRTDLIIYTFEYAPLFKQLGCIFNEKRLNPREPPKCRIFPYMRVKDRYAQHQPLSIHQTIDKTRSIEIHHYLKSYGYIDSINTVLEYRASYEIYDFVLRTDMDCFLTKNFAHYVPFNHSLIVGYGGYSTTFTNRRLKRIAHDMNWKYANRNSLGSTWYGPPSMTHRIANFTITAMIHLTMYEFSTPEREQRLGVLLWPEWHFGVLLLYGGHLAINHLIIAEQFHIGSGIQLLDQGVTSTDSHDIEKNLRLHLHCWHGDEQFSKFAFKAGKYKNIDPKQLMNNTSASGYATRLALEGNTMSLKKLHALLLNIPKS